MRQDTAGRNQKETDRTSRPQPRLRAIICRTGQDNVMDTCLLMLGHEADVEQVPTLAAAMKRCLEGRADILFVNMFPITAKELTALSLFRSMVPDLWLVALASADLKPSLITTGIADEVLVAEPMILGDPRPRQAAARPV